MQIKSKVNIYFNNIIHAALSCIQDVIKRVKKHWEELGDLDRLPVDISIPPSFKSYQLGKDDALEYIFDQ